MNIRCFLTGFIGQEDKPSGGCDALKNGGKIGVEGRVKLACKRPSTPIFTSDEYPMLLDRFYRSRRQAVGRLRRPKGGCRSISKLPQPPFCPFLTT